FRPPYMELNAQAVDIAASLGMSIVLWDIDPRDWTPGMTAEYIASHVISRAQDRSIILLHDNVAASAEAVSIILRELTERGFVFVTIEELFDLNADSGPTLASGVIFRNARDAGRTSIR
ncbi:MAG: hypothetical protein FWC95_03985, partial [Defluviitaleaceae bacterium]|nr:hypothetical protein [Defluviitaleaceae bacterium]